MKYIEENNYLIENEVRNLVHKCVLDVICANIWSQDITEKWTNMENISDVNFCYERNNTSW